jgi:hypothetical protein
MPQQDLTLDGEYLSCDLETEEMMRHVVSLAKISESKIIQDKIQSFSPYFHFLRSPMPEVIDPRFRENKPKTRGGQIDDFRPLTYNLGGGGWHGVQEQIYDILRPQLAMNRFLPLRPHRFPHFRYIHLGGGGDSDIRSMSSIRPICKCRCPPLPKTLVFSHWKRALWACFRENWVYNSGH